MIQPAIRNKVKWYGSVAVFVVFTLLTLQEPYGRWPLHLLGCVLQGAILFACRRGLDAKEEIERPKFQDWMSLPAFAFAGATIYVSLQAARYCTVPVIRGDDLDAAFLGERVIPWTVILGFVCCTFARGRRGEVFLLNVGACGVVVASAVIILVTTSI